RRQRQMLIRDSYMTMSAILTTKNVADTISRGEAGVMMHGPTFMGNPLACAIACRSIKLLKDQDMESRVSHLSKIIDEELHKADGMAIVNDIRVLGTIGVIETAEPVDVGKFQRRCVELGIWVRPFGRNVYIMPPYVISDEDLRTLCRNMITILREFNEA
ncbi:MAG: aminotransferase class III-fold pyridoxal phosphate-dependent enzyme, partial [Muribaculaceae bacterium]|nr:aminotransferase class III-fold pyridoxal phosphate-dependent enzyme [Muribaculaceae bacterium]